MNRVGLNRIGLKFILKPIRIVNHGKYIERAINQLLNGKKTMQIYFFVLIGEKF